ncbi:dTMP kinase [Allocoleopsis franciscana]|uniref:Thymidylate kinase n=1 Tax=Allocoleopsis franciscana PCC 7113 TaxID=1173027 RepID=K9WLQ5_9CYAN|nr:dTMP kinase [Allocoleopsis franciscana]AFZ21093.1 thymidylate kinase [Allocoleopsis franciscana PCC 7113]
MRGKLIVFEGVEGSGKTTQLQRCSQWLEAIGLAERFGEGEKIPPVVVTREPGGTPLGLELRQLLLDAGTNPTRQSIEDRAELLMYAADRAQHVEELLNPQLKLGAIILCDRYTDSTVAYQGYGRGLDLTLIEQLNQIATGGLASDLTLWLDIDAEIGLKRARLRGSADRMEQADLAFHQRVQQGFAQLAASYPQRIVRIDASRSEDEVHSAIQQILRQRLREWVMGNG